MQRAQARSKSSDNKVCNMTQDFPEETASRYDRWYQTRFGRWADRLEKQLLAELLGQAQGKSVLDIGCGTGHFSLWLAEMGYDVTAIDNSDAMLQIAGAKLGDAATVQQMSAENLEFPDNSFDIAFIVTALEFVDDPEKALNEAARVARKSIILGVLNRQSLLGRWRKFTGLLKRNTYSDARFFTPGELARLCRQAAAANTKEADIYWSGALCLRQLVMKQSARCPFRAFIGMRVKLGRS